MYMRRTDLALEARELKGDIPGVRLETRQEGSLRLSRVEILDERGEHELCKPIGRYVTVEELCAPGAIRGEFTAAAELLAGQLRDMLPGEGPVLVAGLGNPSMIADAVGPLCCGHVFATRHLKGAFPEDFEAMREVSVLRTGVTGTTGLESAELIGAVAEGLRPAAVIAVDALAARRMERLCSTVQLTDTGISPGSGVGNARRELNLSTFGVPVIALGVPTVVDAVTLALDTAEKAGISLPEDALDRAAPGMIVTPRDIDERVRQTARILGYAIDLALHPGLTVEDIDMMVG
ncbi:MAG: GPR endopeptidase [Oscillospiraceae bacterium]|nr:GPR endopeptidase [Oscillospiraceae bacterium]